MNITEKAKADYTEFCKLFKGVSFRKVDELVKQHNLSYGALNTFNSGMLDINYKSICATLQNNKGKVAVSSMIEIYDNNGVFIQNIII